MTTVTRMADLKAMTVTRSNPEGITVDTFEALGWGTPCGGVGKPRKCGLGFRVQGYIYIYMYIT